MIKKLSSDEYRWTFQITSEGVIITLHQANTGKQKVFFLAGQDHPVNPLDEHMKSLTDDQCSQWFNEREKKGKNAKAK